MNFEDYKAQLRLLTGRQIRFITSNSNLFDWIMKVTDGEPSDISMSERIFIILNPDKNNTCRYDKTKPFKSYSQGYIYCSANCRCQKEDSGNKLKEIFREKTNDDWKNRLEKSKETNQSRYGVDHSSQTETTKQKFQKTMIERYGAGHALQSSEIQTKKRQTIIDRYGVEHALQSSIILDKAKNTMLSRYGVEHALQSELSQAKRKNTLISTYGVEYPSQSEVVKERMRETNKTKYGVDYFSQMHISPESLLVLNDKQSFSDLLSKISLREAAEMLNVSYAAVIRKCNEYDIERLQSSYELSIGSFLRSEGIEIDFNDRMIIKPLEIDIVIPKLQIGIEFCGLYWHSDKRMQNNAYHLNKTIAANTVGYKLITIFEDEWVHKTNIVKARLRHLLGKSEKGSGARKLFIRDIQPHDVRMFLDTYHIQGCGPHGFAKYGAYEGNKLVAVMTFSKPRIALGRKSGAVELLRFATDGKNYPGVASKLFRHFLREHDPEQVISYADRRWSNGNLYEKLGFSFIGCSSPNYWYVDLKNTVREYRFKYRKNIIIGLVEDGQHKTERQIMEELGWSRIYDCGTLKYLWKKE